MPELLLDQVNLNAGQIETLQLFLVNEQYAEGYLYLQGIVESTPGFDPSTFGAFGGSAISSSQSIGNRIYRVKDL